MKKKILFLRPQAASFTETDRQILEKHFEVKTINFGFFAKSPVKFLASIYQTIIGVMWADGVFVWFADVHALLAIILSKWLSKKSIAVIGGYEVAKVPEINYGGLLRWRTRWVTRFVIRHASQLIAVSEFNKMEILRCIENVEPLVAYNSVDTDFFKPEGEKEKIVLTACSLNKRNIAVKGLDTFIKCAKLVPEAKFVIAGSIDQKMIEDVEGKIPCNIVSYGFLDKEALRRLYQRSKVYCQLSRYESFGVALAEAMSCCCIPVVTREGALPEVVGDTGFYVPYGDVETTARAIREALQSDKGKMARQRVIERFSIIEREKKLLALIDAVFNDH